MNEQSKTLKQRWLGVRYSVYRWIGWIILCVIAFATTWLVQINKSIETPDSSVQNEQQRPDYTLKNFITFSMTPEGKIDSRLQAQNMLHYPKSNTKLSTPIMLFYKREQPNWHVKAEKGEITPNGEEIWLQGMTTFWREETADQMAMMILSKNVYFHKPTQFAESKALSIIHNNNTITQSIGMKAYLQIEQIELFSRVRGYYETK